MTDPYERFANTCDQTATEPTVIKIRGVTWVYWPPYDPEAESIVRLNDIIDFAHTDESAFDRFRHARHWH